ncbi:MAG: hypothetical protein ACRYGK_13485 [Janthinobacterium lividum]
MVYLPDFGDGICKEFAWKQGSAGSPGTATLHQHLAATINPYQKAPRHIRPDTLKISDNDTRDVNICP